MYVYPDGYQGAAASGPDVVTGRLLFGTPFSPRPGVWPPVTPIGDGMRGNQSPVASTAALSSALNTSQPIFGFGDLTLVNDLDWIRNLTEQFGDAITQQSLSGASSGVGIPALPGGGEVPGGGLAQPNWWPAGQQQQNRPEQAKQRGAAAGLEGITHGSGSAYLNIYKQHITVDVDVSQNQKGEITDVDVTVTTV